MWDYIARWFEECCRCVLMNVCKSQLPLFNVRECMNLKIITNMDLFQEDGECTTACWEFRSSRVLIGGVLSAGWFSVRYCFFGEFFFVCSIYFFISLFVVFTVFYPVLSYVPHFFPTGLMAISVLVSTFSHSPPFHSLFSHFHLLFLTHFWIRHASRIPLLHFHSIIVWGVIPAIRGSCQCITPLHLPSLCLCSFYTGSEKACD